MSGIARNVLDTIRIVDTREIGHDSYEICATAKASYEEQSGEMQVALDSFVRHFEMRGKDELSHPAWLPRRDLVKTHISWDGAADAAKEIFNAWAHKVQKDIPPPSQWQRDASWLRVIEGKETVR